MSTQSMYSYCTGAHHRSILVHKRLLGNTSILFVTKCHVLMLTVMSPRLASPSAPNQPATFHSSSASPSP